MGAALDGVKWEGRDLDGQLRNLLLILEEMEIISGFHKGEMCVLERWLQTQFGQRDQKAACLNDPAAMEGALGSPFRKEFSVHWQGVG